MHCKVQQSIIISFHSSMFLWFALLWRWYSCIKSCLSKVERNCAVPVRWYQYSEVNYVYDWLWYRSNRKGCGKYHLLEPHLQYTDKIMRFIYFRLTFASGFLRVANIFICVTDNICYTSLFGNMLTVTASLVCYLTCTQLPLHLSAK